MSNIGSGNPDSNIKPAETEKELNDGLVWAAGMGGNEEVKRLLQAGADVRARYNPPLGKFNNGGAEVTEINGRDITVTYQLGSCGNNTKSFTSHDLSTTALQAAAARGYLDIVESLIGSGSEVNKNPAKVLGRTVLQAAAGGGHKKVVRLLLGYKADVDAPAASYGGRTALQAAAEGGHEKVVQLPLDHKADVNAPAAKNKGGTALQVAAGGGYEKVVQLLLDRKANVNGVALGGS